MSRQMFAEILSLIARLRAAPASILGAERPKCSGRQRERHASMRRASAPVPARAGGAAGATTGTPEVRPSPRFDRPFARTEHDLSLHKPVEGLILARNLRESG
jgi:hypothetical protein